MENDKSDVKNKIVIVVDAVINTGNSIIKAIEYLRKSNLRKIIIATLIIQKDALKLAGLYKEISFYALRISVSK